MKLDAEGFGPWRPHGLRGELALAAAAYTVVATGVTWPLLVDIGKAVAGFQGGDSLVYVWLLWWFREALVKVGHLPSQVSALYFPLAASHPIVWLHPVVPLLGMPLTSLLGPVATYNLCVLASFVVAGVSGYLLCREICGQGGAAFVGGLVFSLAPARMGHALAGHLLLGFGSAMLPLYVLALWLWLRRPSLAVSALYTVSLLLTLLGQPNFIGYFLLPVTLVLLAAHWLTQRTVFPLHWRRLALCWVAAGLAFLPFVWPTLAEWVGGQTAYLQPSDSGEYSADLLSFITASPFHPIWAGLPPGFLTSALDRLQAMEEGYNYLGLVAVVLAGVALWRRRPEVWPWLAIAGISLLFSLGPTLHVGGRDTQIPMPYALIDDLPFFLWSRTPARVAITAMVAVSVVSAMGVACLTRWTRWKGCGVVCAVGLSLLIAFEYLPMWPFPMDGHPIDRHYYQLARDPSSAGLLEMPVADSRPANKYAMYYQTVHRRPLVGGYFERDPLGAGELREFADRLLSPSEFDPAVLPAPSADNRVAVLGDMGVSEVVAHPSMMTDSGDRTTLAFIPEVLGAPYYAEGDLLAWHVPPAKTELPPYTLLLSDRGWKASDDPVAMRLTRQGLIFVYAKRPGTAALTLELQGQPSSPEQQVWLSGSETPMTAGPERARHRVTLQLHAGLNWFAVRPEGCEDCRADFYQVSLQ